MASFEHTLNEGGVHEFLGRLKFVSGSYEILTGLTGSGGTISTGLRKIHFFNARDVSGAGATVNTVGVRLQNGGALPPFETGDVFIVANNPSTGEWFAIGE